MRSRAPIGTFASNPAYHEVSTALIGRPDGFCG
jgi:hypothetical protein